MCSELGSVHRSRDAVDGSIATDDQLRTANIYIFVFTPSTLVNDIKGFAVSLVNIIKHQLAWTNHGEGQNK